MPDLPMPKRLPSARLLEAGLRAGRPEEPAPYPDTGASRHNAHGVLNKARETISAVFEHCT
jgi:hypothetical protein